MKSLSDPTLERFAGKRALLYGRVSTVVQESDGYSLDAQRHRGREIAALARMRVVGEDFEQGSGQDWDLAGIHTIIRRAKRREFDVLVLKNTSRLSRRRGRQNWIDYQLRDAGAEIYFYDEPYDDTAAGRMQRGIMAEIAEFQVEQSRELSMEARYAKIEQHGRPVGNGQTPYGWRRVIDASGVRPRTIGYEHDEAEAAVIRRLRELKTTSTRELCDRFNAEGIPAPGKWRPTERRPRSGRWTTGTIFHILRNRMTWGEYRYGERQVIRRNGKGRVIQKPDATVYTLEFPPILTKEEVEEIQAVLRERRYRRGALKGTENDPYLLRGLLRCGHCGGGLSCRHPTQGDPWRLYGCIRSIATYAKRDGKPLCPLPWLIAVRSPKRGKTDGIEEVVTRALRSSLLDEEALRREIRRSREASDDVRTHAERLAFVRGQIRRKTAALDEATRRWAEAEDELDRASFGNTREALKRELRGLAVDLEQLEAYEPVGITDDEEVALLALAAETRQGLDIAEPSRVAFILRKLQIRGVVMLDPEGPYHIGRHRYAIEWGGLLDLGRYAEETGHKIRTFVNFEPIGKEICASLLQQGGYIQIPTAPGLGVELEEEALRARAYQPFPDRRIRQFSDEA